MADRRHPASSLRTVVARTVVARTVVLLVAFAAVASSAATARSQEAEATGDFPDGAYSGGIYFKIGGYLDFGGIVGMTNSIDTTGDATLVIDTDMSSSSGRPDAGGNRSHGRGRDLPRRKSHIF